MKMMCYSVMTQAYSEKEIPTGFEPTTFQLLVRTLYHWAKGDSWELRPLNVHCSAPPPIHPSPAPACIKFHIYSCITSVEMI